MFACLTKNCCRGKIFVPHSLIFYLTRHTFCKSVCPTRHILVRCELCGNRSWSYDFQCAASAAHFFIRGRQDEYCQTKSAMCDLFSPLLIADICRLPICNSAYPQFFCYAGRCCISGKGCNLYHTGYLLLFLSMRRERNTKFYCRGCCTPFLYREDYNAGILLHSCYYKRSGKVLLCLLCLPRAG